MLTLLVNQSNVLAEKDMTNLFLDSILTGAVVIWSTRSPCYLMTTRALLCAIVRERRRETRCRQSSREVINTRAEDR